MKLMQTVSIINHTLLCMIVCPVFAKHPLQRKLRLPPLEMETETSI